MHRRVTAKRNGPGTVFILGLVLSILCESEGHQMVQPLSLAGRDSMASGRTFPVCGGARCLPSRQKRCMVSAVYPNARMKYTVGVASGYQRVTVARASSSMPAFV